MMLSAPLLKQEERSAVGAPHVAHEFCIQLEAGDDSPSQMVRQTLRQRHITARERYEDEDGVNCVLYGAIVVQ